MKDLFGKAIFDFQTNNSPENLITETSISDKDEMSVAYLFRSFDEMPKIEQLALHLCKGKILDVGSGAGSHSLYLQNYQKQEVVAIDISENAIATCRLRGLKNAFVQDVFQLENQKFDTILLLMNGTGIAGKLSKLEDFLKHLKSLLHRDGQILIDSSDLIYMFDDDEKQALLNQKDIQYYGEVEFNLSYKNQNEAPFDWLYVDFEMLKNVASSVGLSCEKIIDGENFDYLAKIEIQSFF
jgi:SAM-dependent methyltransferase